MVTLNLKDNSYLEFIPEQIIPYKNSRFYQKTNLKIDDSSTVVYSETIVPGRIAMGEMFDFDVCYLKTEMAARDHLGMRRGRQNSACSPQEISKKYYFDSSKCVH